MPNGFKLNYGKFKIFCNLITGKGSLLRFCEANYVLGHTNAKNDKISLRSIVIANHLVQVLRVD